MNLLNLDERSVGASRFLAWNMVLGERVPKIRQHPRTAAKERMGTLALYSRVGH